MKRVIHGILVLALLAPCHVALAQALSRENAVALAEKFVAENGYTNAAPSRIKDRLDSESIEWASNRDEILRLRFNTLQPIAIGAKHGRKGVETGWSIAFDYVSGTPGERDACRVVTLDSDGSNMRIEHVGGIRKYFFGFD
ncbi:MAG: hypothetical protein ACREO0_00455 [Pseudoxanthomonas sp.]